MFSNGISIVMQDKLKLLPNTLYEDATVLITGAGGTIGSGILNSINAKQIVAIDISEYAIYKLQRANKNSNVNFIVGDISDTKLCNMIFNKYAIDYVFNAAAYKHVDALEDDNNIYSVIKNNIMSVINLCKHANSFKAMIHISSDKAVNPSCIMGFTKLWCERIIQQYAKSSTATMKIVRFGNVYNSSGSFIETLQYQIANGLPITVTDIKMKRYFLTINDAVALINEVVKLDNTNATYILEMGEEISILDIVNKFNNNSPIAYIGKRPGEKLSEELVYSNEQLLPTANPLINTVAWTNINIIDNINALTTELNKEEICTDNLIKILITMMTL